MAAEPATRTDLLTSPSPGRRRAVLVWDGGMTSAELAEGVTIIGRGHDAGILVDHASVSRRHAALHVAGTSLHIEDLGSSNGTFVAGSRLASGAMVPLGCGVAARVGSASLAVLERSQEGTDAGASAMPAASAARAGDAVMVAVDPSMKKVLRLIELAAPTPLTVLVVGETGVGKEVVAEAIHAMSPRASRPLVRINCAALPEALFESELFGHERGAFTGANAAKAGLIEVADGGTIFLDEVGEMPLAIQAKVLRVLETGDFTRVGSVTARRVDARFIAATNRVLHSEVELGRFRRDLFFRLNGFTITIPPLRERLRELEPLTRALTRRAALRLGLPEPVLGSTVLPRLAAHDWPGNVRELRNVLECAVVMARGSVLEAEHVLLPSKAAAAPAEAVASPALADDLRSLERRRILEALELCAGNQTLAAKHLGIPRRTFLSRLDQYDIPRPRKRGE